MARRAAGWRFGRHLDMAVPSVVEHWKAAGEGDDELRDYCLQALEAFVLRSPLDSKRHLDSIFDIAQQSLSYDPNYADDMEQDTEEDEEDEEAYALEQLLFKALLYFRDSLTCHKLKA